jgi:hypothetical protein
MKHQSIIQRNIQFLSEAAFGADQVGSGDDFSFHLFIPQVIGFQHLH